jgi:hypothetical protein
MIDDLPETELPDKDAYIGELRQALGDLERLLGEDGSTSSELIPPISARAALELQARQLPAPPVARSPSASHPVALGPASLPQRSSRPVEQKEDSRDLQLLMRFAAGSLILGAEELVARARRWEEQAPAEGEVAPGGAPLEEAGYLELARYWALGALAYGRRSGVSAVRSALGGPEGLAPSLLNLTERATSILFLRPLRRPLEGAIRRAQVTSRDWILDGWREEQLSRWIAQNGVPEILDDVIAIISRNPELAELVKNQLSQQSKSAASSILESGRKLTAVGDDVAENFARRLLRRGLRVEIPRIELKSELATELALRERVNGDRGSA